ncbi:unnamed protein product, partial [marine sediment metagenome]
EVKMMKLRSINGLIGLILLTFVLGLFAYIVHRELGGDTTLGVIIGHCAAWVEMLVIYLYRKKPPTEPPKE